VTLAVLGWAVIAARRSSSWPANRRRPVAQLGVGLAGGGLAVGALATLTATGRALFDQRDITLRQIGYVTPATVTLLAAAAGSVLMVTALRTWWLVVKRRS
jgi:hypothetical protein